MKHEIKVGDRFRLGSWEWRVQTVGKDGFSATHDVIANRKASDWECFSFSDAAQLDWIKPEPTFTKEQVEAIKEKLEQGYPPNVGDLFVWLDSHTEKE